MDESDPDGADPDGDGSGPVDAADLAPANLAARAAVGLVALTWDAPAAGAESVTGYEIQRADGEDGAFVVLVADTGSAARSHFDTTAVEPGGVYRYRVAARRGSERSRPSATAWAFIPQIEIEEPEPPVALPHQSEIELRKPNRDEGQSTERCNVTAMSTSRSTGTPCGSPTTMMNWSPSTSRRVTASSAATST